MKRERIVLGPGYIHLTGRPATVLRALVLFHQDLAEMRSKHKKIELDGSMDDWECALDDFVAEVVKRDHVTEYKTKRPGVATWRGIKFTG